MTSTQPDQQSQGQITTPAPAPAPKAKTKRRAAAGPGEYTYAAGLDIGNGYVKGVIESTATGAGAADSAVDVIDMPSVAAVLVRPNEVPDPDTTAASAIGTESDSSAWYNNLDLSFSSSLVPDTYRRLIGRRGLASRAATISEFDLAGNKSKAQQDLSKVLVLGILAGKAVRDYVAAHGELPGPDSAAAHLTVRAVVALALPIDEYERHRGLYATGFTGAAGSGDGPVVHQVRLNNFTTPVTVSVIFDSVMVLPEGASAQFAINHYGLPLMETMLEDATGQGVELPEGVTAQDLLGVTDTIGIDVGEGTVNFPVFTGGQFNPDASRTMAGGYGEVLEAALSAMTEQGVNHTYSNRKQLADLLLGPISPFKRRDRAKVMEYVDSSAEFFVEDLAVELSKVLSVVGSFTEVIYVYGGGSGPLREQLYPALVTKVAEMGGDTAAPVLYLDSSYSRGLNREGLILAARNRARTLGGTK